MPWKKIVRLYAPPVLYAGLIFILSSIPQVNLPDLGFDFFDKVLHAIEYAVFAFLIIRAFSPDIYGSVRFPVLAAALVLSAGYGGLDEYHQSFVPGRLADFADFIFDFLGTLIGLAVFYWFRGRNDTKQPSAGQTQSMSL